MDWGSALLRAPAGDGIVAGYSRLLRLLAGLNNGQVLVSLQGILGRQLTRIVFGNCPVIH
jgi:hypothetical protein